MTAFLFLVGAWAGFSLAVVAVGVLAAREPEPVVLPARKCGPDCGPCAAADDAVGARLDLSLWDLELQEHTS